MNTMDTISKNNLIALKTKITKILELDKREPVTVQSGINFYINSLTKNLEHIIQQKGNKK